MKDGLHLRVWNGIAALAACQLRENKPARVTTTPDRLKVTCQRCKAVAAHIPEGMQHG